MEVKVEFILENHIKLGSAILFAIGMYNLIASKNMIKKIIGLNIMDTSIFMFFISLGYLPGMKSPIIENAPNIVNPLPSSLMLTGIVVAVVTTSILIALTIKLNEIYGTVNLGEILKYRGETNGNSN